MTAEHGFTVIVSLFAIGGAIEAGASPLIVAMFVACVALAVWLGLSLWIAHTDTRDQRRHAEIVQRRGRQIRGRL